MLSLIEGETTFKWRKTLSSRSSSSFKHHRLHGKVAQCLPEVEVLKRV